MGYQINLRRKFQLVCVRLCLWQQHVLSLFSIFVFGLVIANIVFADNIYHERLLRDQTDKSIYYVRQFKTNTGWYYWGLFDYENSQIDEQVQGVSTINENNEITVYFQNMNSTYDVQTNKDRLREAAIYPVVEQART